MPRRYYAYVYVEDDLGRNDGSVGPPVHLQVDVANSFVKAPLLSGAPSREAVPFIYTAASTSGVAWAVIVEEDAPWTFLQDGGDNISHAAHHIKNHTFALPCDEYAEISVSDVAVPPSSGILALSTVSKAGEKV